MNAPQPMMVRENDFPVGMRGALRPLLRWIEQVNEVLREASEEVEAPPPVDPLTVRGGEGIEVRQSGGVALVSAVPRSGGTQAFPAGLPDGTADYQVPVWDNTEKEWVPGPPRLMAP